MAGESSSAEGPDAAAIKTIMEDASLNPIEKARKKQALLNARWLAEDDEDENAEPDAPDLEHLKCAICMELCDRPVTAPCQHNACLGCFRRWTNQGKKQCPTCRAELTKAVIQNPRINTMLTVRIRQARKPQEQRKASTKAAPIPEDRPDEAFMTANAKRKGLSNACSGRMRVTCPPHHFGPIAACFDPERNQGITVGEAWQNRLHCRQWGAHLPHVAGIAGQSEVGAQSVVLSGGYEDDRDEGEWFLYTGSGGRDLSGNKRTNKEQSSDQKFELYNKSLLRSCERGLPVRVVRSFKEKRSAYAPTDAAWGVRYDGIYRITAAWRIAGNQGKLMCRFLFRRCDPEPAPWETGDKGDGAWGDLPPEAVEEMNRCKEKVHKCGEDAFWAWREAKGEWGWVKAPPAEASAPGKGPAKGQSLVGQLKKKVAQEEKALNKCRCGICHTVLNEPLTTPCGHYFCKSCLITKLDAAAPDAAAASTSSRTFRVRKVPKKCPACPADLTEFMKSAQVNHAMAAQIAEYRANARTAQAALDTELAAQAAAAPVLEELPEGAAPPEGAAACGWALKVLWPAEGEEGEWYLGSVAEFNAEDGKHFVKHEDGTNEWYELQKEEVKWLRAVEAPAGASAAEGDSAGDEAGPSEAPEAAADAATKARMAAANAIQAKGDAARALEAEGLAAAAKAAAAVRTQELYALYSGVYDASLIDGMIEDQDGDVAEVALMLKRMVKQQRAVDKAPVSPKPAKAEEAEASADGAAEGSMEDEDAAPDADASPRENSGKAAQAAPETSAEAKAPAKGGKRKASGAADGAAATKAKGAAAKPAAKRARRAAK